MTLRAALVAVSLLLAVTAEASERLRILHFNDLDRMEAVPRLAAALARERIVDGHVLVTNGGDLISPSLLSGFDQGAHMVALMNAVEVDLAVLGNHEFDFGPEVLAARLDEAEFDWLGANIDPAMPGTAPFRLVAVGPYKVGFFGLVTDSTPVISSPGPGLVFSNPVERAAAVAASLREAGADLVVALAHIGHAEDLRAMAHVDLVLAGHDHLVAARYDGRAAMVQAGSNGEYLAIIDLTLDTVEQRGRKRFTWTPEIRFARTDSLAPEPVVAQMVAGLESMVSDELNIPIGRAAPAMDTRRTTVRGEETVFGNLVADAMRAATGAHVGIVNGGGIRGDRIYDAGQQLLRRDILTELPFGNRIVKLALNGVALRQALEHGLSLAGHGSGGFPQISGLQLTYDLNAPAGARLLSVAVGGARLDPSHSYTLATNSFLARGGDGYVMLANAERLVDATSGPLVASAVIAHLEQPGTVWPTVEGRIRTRR